MTSEVQFTHEVASSADAASEPLNNRILPLELLQHIIDNVDITSSEGRASLLAFSYVNRAFTVMSQKRLFSDIYVQLKVRQQDNLVRFFEDEETNGPKFLSLLDGSPHLASYVRNLIVTLIDPRQYEASFRPMSSLQSILPRLQGLRMLRITGEWSWKWKHLEISPKILTFFTDVAQRLPGLDVHRFRNFPISLFHGCPTLQSLSIGSLALDTSIIPTTRAKLKFLEVLHPEVAPKYKPDELISWFKPTSPFDITKLVGLKVILWDFRGVPELLAYCSRTLEELDVRIRSPVYARTKFSYDSEIPVLEPEHQIPNFGALHKLRYLTLLGTIFSNETYGYFDANLRFIFSILETLSPKDPPTLELTLDIQVSDTPVGLLVQIASSKHLFRALNNEQMRNRFASIKLRFRRLAFKPKDTSDTTSVDILDCNEDLKNLREQGILTYVT